MLRRIFWSLVSGICAGICVIGFIAISCILANPTVGVQAKIAWTIVLVLSFVIAGLVTSGEIRFGRRRRR